MTIYWQKSELLASVLLASSLYGTGQAAPSAETAATAALDYTQLNREGQNAIERHDYVAAIWGDGSGCQQIYVHVYEMFAMVSKRVSVYDGGIHSLCQILIGGCLRMDFAYIIRAPYSYGGSNFSGILHNQD
jgi:hypothetical protein